MLRIPTQHARFVLLSSPFLICYLSLTVRNLALIIQSLFTYFLSPSVPLKQLQNLYSIPRRRNKFNIPITRSVDNSFLRLNLYSQDSVSRVIRLVLFLSTPFSTAVIHSCYCILGSAVCLNFIRIPPADWWTLILYLFGGVTKNITMSMFCLKPQTRQDAFYHRFIQHCTRGLNSCNKARKTKTVYKDCKKKKEKVLITFK